MRSDSRRLSLWGYTVGSLRLSAMAKDPSARRDTPLPYDTPRVGWSFKRIVMFVVFVLVAVVVVIVAREIVLLLTVKVNPSIDYATQRNAIVLRAAEERATATVGDGASQRARLEAVLADFMRENTNFANTLAAPTEGQAGVPNIRFDLVFGEPQAKDTPADIKLAKAAFAHHKKINTLAKLKELQTLLGATRVAPSDRPLFDLDDSFVSPARNTARFLGVLLVDALRNDDVAAASDITRTLLAFGATISGQGGPLDPLLGVAIQSVALQAIREELAQKPNPQMAIALFAEVRSAPKVLQTNDALELQRIEMLDAIQWTHSDAGRFLPSQAQSLAKGTALSGGKGDSLSFLFANREQSEAVVNRVIDEYIAQLARPLSKRSSAQADAIIDGLSPGYILVGLLMPPLNKNTNALTSFTTVNNGTLLLLALEAHAAKHGSYPQSLSVLAPSFGGQLPVDVVSADGTFGYTLRTPTQEDARPFLLYSVGIDGVDNGGSQTQPGDMSALGSPKRGENQDFVITLPRGKQPKQ